MEDIKGRGRRAWKTLTRSPSTPLLANMRLPLDALLLAQRSALSIPGQVNDTQLYLPNSEPKYAQPLDPQLGSFSIEMDHWQDWAGETLGAPNAFVNTALGQLTKRTGQPVYLRVGGMSLPSCRADTSQLRGQGHT